MIKRIYIAYIFTFFGFFYTFAQESYKTLIYEGNQQFEKGNYESSSSKFLGAIKQNPKDFAAHYNLGNALYKQKKYDEAKAEYEKASALAQTKADKTAALYNQGNAYMQSENPQKAAELYKQALKYDPYNENVRKNYEIAMLKDKENQQKQEGKDGKSGGGGGEGKDKSKDSEKDKNGQPQNGEQGNKQQGKGNGQDPNDTKNQNNGSNMPKDQQDAILNRIEGRERETARKILNKNSYAMPQSNAKDW